jgi:tetratricopeptide (TPR) repeat protein
MPARAGLYNPEQPPVAVNAGLRFEDFNKRVKEIRALDAPESKQRAEFQKRIAELQAKARAGTAGTDDLLSLSAYQILLRDYAGAVQSLNLAEARAPDDFRVLANLATAYYYLDNRDRAVYYQSRAVRVLDGVCPGWTSAQLQWPRRVEGRFLNYLRLRLTESRRPPARGGDELAPLTDALFPGLRFVGPDGEYPLGQLAPAQQARMPADAVAVVEQMLLDLPHDPDLNLYWLLAELLNARGDVVDAANLLGDLVFNRGLSARAARRHRQMLQPAQALVPDVKNGRLAWWLTPRALAPGADQFFAEAAWPSILQAVHERMNALTEVAPSAAVEKSAAEPTPDERRPAKPPPSYLPDEPRLLVVGAVGLVLIIGLAYLQGFLVGRRRARGPAGKE